jgi:hypothetical protein
VIPSCFKRLRALSEGSVTCQTSPWGVINRASLIARRSWQQRKHRQRDMSAYAMGCPVVDRTPPQAALERGPRLLDSHELFVTQRQIFRGQRVIVGVDHELASSHGGVVC